MKSTHAWLLLAQSQAAAWPLISDEQTKSILQAYTWVGSPFGVIALLAHSVEDLDTLQQAVKHETRCEPVTKWRGAALGLPA